MTNNALNLLKKNYFRQGETTWEDLCNRVSYAISQAENEEDKEKWKELFFNMMQKMDFIPSSPCLMNAGTENQQLSSCFIISIDDNIESIYQAKAEMAKIFQKNGGVGFNISALRPEKTVVQTSKGYSCGVVGFMEEFDLTADIITRNNARKGAIKIDLNDWHPDVFKFISCKDTTDKFNRMNISISASNEFMNAVINDLDWQLKFPDYENMDKELYHKEWHGDIEQWIQNGYPVKIYETIKAKELYNTIMKHAWKTGEPGVSFRDNMNKDNPNPHMGKIDSTNPCFTGDMRLLTENGYKTFEELCDTQFNVVNKDNNITPSKVWCSGEKEVIELSFNGKNKIKCTPNHVFMLTDGTECEAKDLLHKRVMPHDGTGYEVTKITPIGIQKVYDFTEPVTHWGIVEDKIVHNCAEFCSIPYNSCNLGSINLSNFVLNNNVDWDKLEFTIRNAVRFLDDMITVNVLPIDKISKVTKSVRSVGLGTMGFADMLYKLNIVYGSKECYELIDKIYHFISSNAQEASVNLAKNKGVYMAYEGSEWEQKGIKVRNSNFLSIAPTGSISFLSNTSGGIEPNFALVYTRRTNDGTLYHVVNPVLENYLKSHDMYNDEILNKIVANNGRWIPELPKYFVTAQDVTPQTHVDVLAKIQEYVDLAVSKCVAKGTLIQTNKGIIPIEKLGDAFEKKEEGFYEPLKDLFVVDENGEWQKVTKHYYGGNKPTKKIRFNNGNTLECSFNHKLMTTNGWRKSSDLKIGDAILNYSFNYNSPEMIGGLPIPNNYLEYHTNANAVFPPKNMSSDLALLLGMIISDGSITESTGCVKLTTANDDVEKLFRQLCCSLFNLENNNIKTTIDKRTKNTRGVYFTSRNVAKWLIDLIGNGCENKTIPEQILIGSQQEQINCLNGLTLDGYISRSNLVIYEGYSYRLAKQIFAICCNLKCKPYFGTKCVKNGRRSKFSYSVKINENILTPIEKHKQKLLNGTFFYPVPEEIKKLKLSDLSTKNEKYNSLRTLIRNKFNSIRSDNIFLSDEIKFDRNLYITKITDIEDSANELYDIEVENTHSYLINNIISHNTVNLPNNATVDDISNVYISAWKQGIKGITIYRDGSRENQTLSVNKKDKEVKKDNNKLDRGNWKPKAKDTVYYQRKLKIGCGKLNLFIGWSDSEQSIQDFYVKRTGSGGCERLLESTAIAMSAVLRLGGNLSNIEKAFKGIGGCNSFASQRGKGEPLSKGNSCGIAILNELKAFLSEHNITTQELKTVNVVQSKKNSKCPECGELTLLHEGGCVTCSSCGWSKCN